MDSCSSFNKRILSISGPFFNVMYFKSNACRRIIFVDIMMEIYCCCSESYTLFRKARIKELSLLFKVYNKSIFVKNGGIMSYFLKLSWIKTNIFKKTSSFWKDWIIAFFIVKIMFVRGIFFQWLSFSADCISMFTHVYRFHQMQYIHGK